MVSYKHEVLKDYLIGKIRSGEYVAGSAIASELSLAKQFQISRNTVRQACKALEAQGYLYSVRGKGTFVKDGSPQASRKIALLIYDTAYMTNQVTAKLICGIDAQLQQSGYVLDILASRRSFGEEQMSQMLSTYAGFLIGAYQIDGMILHELERSQRPFLFVKNYLPGYEDRAFRIDYERAGFLVAEHLIQRGCRDLGLVYAGDGISISADFGRGVRSGCLEYGVRLRQRNVLVRDFQTQLDGSTVAMFGDEYPDGIVCQTDEQAIGLYRALRSCGISVPGRVLLTGCNHLELLPPGVPSLTTLDLSMYDLGLSSARQLLQMIRGESCSRPVAVLPQLIEGASTGVDGCCEKR